MTKEKRELTENSAKELKAETIDERVIALELETLLKDGLIFKEISRNESAVAVSLYIGRKFRMSVRQI